MEKTTSRVLAYRSCRGRSRLPSRRGSITLDVRQYGINEVEEFLVVNGVIRGKLLVGVGLLSCPVFMRRVLQVTQWTYNCSSGVIHEISV